MRTRLRKITIWSYVFIAYINLLWSLIVILALYHPEFAEDLSSGAAWCFGLMPVVLWAAIIFAFLRIRTFSFDEEGFTVSYPLLFLRKRIAAEEIGRVEAFVKSDFGGKGLSFAYRVIHVNLTGPKAGKYYELRELDYLHFDEILKVKVLKIDSAKRLRLKREYIRENSPSIFDLIFWIGLFLFGDYLIGWMICLLFARHYGLIIALPLIPIVFMAEWLYIEFLLRMRREKERLKIRS